MIQKDSFPSAAQPSHWLLLIVLFGIISRLIPHLPNMTPLVSLSIIANLRLNRWCAMGAMLIILLVADSLLRLLFKHPAFSLHHWWPCFTYSGFLFTSFLCSYQTHTRLHQLLGNAFIGTLVFWMWTNFGVWLTSGLYVKTMTGLGTCYFVALPFLRNSVIGSIGWMLIYFFSLHPLPNKTLGEIAR